MIQVTKQRPGYPNTTAIDAFSTIRNKASLAHANELLDEPEAMAMVNGMFTIFRYVQDSLRRYRQI